MHAVKFDLRKIPVIVAMAALSLGRLGAAADNSLDSNETLFTLLAALNAAGYNLGIDSPDNSPLRRQLRDYLAQQNIPSVKDIHDFYVFKSPSIAPYLSLALSLNGPPDFGWRARTVDLPPDALAYETFVPLLQRFYIEAKVPELWKRVQPIYDAELEKYHEPLSNITLLVNSYLRRATAGDMNRRFQVYIDLLAAPDQIQSRSYGNDYFVVVTAAKTPNVFELRHTYLHFVIEPLASKYKLDIMKNAALSDYLATARGIDESYKNDFLLLVTESLIKAIESKLDHTPATVNTALQEGYILTPFFAEALTKYEKQPVGMRLYFPDMMASLDAAKERKRIEGVTFTSKVKVESGPAPVAVAPPMSASAKVLELADAAYAKKDIERARGYYFKALDEPGVGGDHARAYYGLARLNLLDRKPEVAEELFRKTLESSPDPQTQAWAEVYLGRLWDSQGDRDEAMKHYEAALAVKGASDQARKAAEKELKEPLTKPKSDKTGKP
jgi:tetratricopeptide (TPR) repeat protein